MFWSRGHCGSGIEMNNRQFPWLIACVSAAIVLLIFLPILMKSSCQRRPSKLEPESEVPPRQPLQRPKDFSGRVIGVMDGDTIEVLYEADGTHSDAPEKIPIRVRLAEIDCPEKGQPFGQKAKHATSELCFDRMVRVISKGHDRYDRSLARVVLPDGRILNEELVRAGYAWWFVKYSKNDVLKMLESEARTNRSGLWVDENPIPPWEWRKYSRSRQ